MKYYLVALFNTDSYKRIERFQKNFSRKYRNFNDLPILHINIDTISDPDIEKFSEIIISILKPYKKFKVKINPNISIDMAKRCANLEVQREGYISTISRNINEKLSANGFNVKDISENSEGFKLNIPIALSNRAIKDMAQVDFQCIKNGSENFSMAKIDRIELWKITGTRSRTIVKSFQLRDF